jgi:hypothetical protein
VPQPAAQAIAYNPWIGWTYIMYLFNKLYSIKKRQHPLIEACSGTLKTYTIPEPLTISCMTVATD